jgi:hypothetical protein
MYEFVFCEQISIILFFGNFEKTNSGEKREHYSSKKYQKFFFFEKIPKLFFLKSNFFIEKISRTFFEKILIVFFLKKLLKCFPRAKSRIFYQKKLRIFFSEIKIFSRKKIENIFFSRNNIKNLSRKKFI